MRRWLSLLLRAIVYNRMYYQKLFVLSLRYTAMLNDVFIIINKLKTGKKRATSLTVAC